MNILIGMASDISFFRKIESSLKIDFNIMTSASTTIQEPVADTPRLLATQKLTFDKLVQPNRFGTDDTSKEILDATMTWVSELNQDQQTTLIRNFFQRQLDGVMRKESKSASHIGSIELQHGASTYLIEYKATQHSAVSNALGSQAKVYKLKDKESMSVAFDSKPDSELVQELKALQ